MDGLVRIVFQLEPGSWHGSVTERLWAEPVGGDRYRLRNTPFYAFGVSYADVVFGAAGEDGIEFAGVSLGGGHSTYRVKIAATKSAFTERWRRLAELGCSYEEGDLVLAIDVPPRADIHAVYALLDEGEAAGDWTFEEGHCGHAVDGAGTGAR